MLVSLAWLKRYVDIPVDTEVFIHELTMLGLNVEHAMGSGLTEERVVVGHVMSADAHPDADKLKICKVDIGSGEPLDIVCGASNVAAGQNVAVATIGAKLPNGLKIRKSKIRGHVSHGMICSMVELGLGDEGDGILVLEADLEPGIPVTNIIGDSDVILDIEITPNRPDQLSHIGVAREVSALYSTPVKMPESNVATPKVSDPAFSIRIDDPQDCYRFTGRVIRNIKVGPSPEWLKTSLERIGLSSINNIVDVTNFVMMELGQPMHAYDLGQLKGRIGVRRARESEKIEALDGVEYKLKDHYLVITDGDTPVSVAGVIGGMATSVTDSTTNILLESAAFNPRVVRATRKSMNISTDASYRFERGSDREMCMRASERAAALIMELAGGESGEALDEFPTHWSTHHVTVRRAASRRILGYSSTVAEISSLLTRLHLPVVESDDDSVTVNVPSFREDIVEEIDLIEEIARLNGYDKIGQGHHFRATAFARADPWDLHLRNTALHFVSRGHYEIITTSFTDGSEVLQMGWSASDPRSRPITVRNPLTSNHSSMRTSLLPGTLDIIRWNFDHGTRNVHLVNQGVVFMAADGGVGLPNETVHALVAKTRTGQRDFWDNSNKPVDLIDIKREVEVWAVRVGVDLGQFSYDFDATIGHFTYSHRDRILIEGGIIPAALANARHIDQPVWYADIDQTAVFELREGPARFRSISGYPSSKRDLSLVTPTHVAYATVEKALVKHGGALLESLQLFDVYRGEHLAEGNTAFGVRLQFRSAEATLTDEDVDAVVEKMISKLESELGVVLRS